MPWCFAASLLRQLAWQGSAQNTEMRKMVLEAKSCDRQVKTVVFTFFSAALNFLCCQRQEVDRN